MIEDKKFCMSSYLMFRMLVSADRTFRRHIIPKIADIKFDRIPVHNSIELHDALSSCVSLAAKDGDAALALSGGIDSAILARFMPKGTVAYTFKCVVPGVQVTDETEAARRYATECGLEHRVVEIYWDDFIKYAPLLMKHKGAPIHSIEVQIFKAALQAKNDGFKKIIFGENADIIYGGMNGLLEKDWLFGEFVERYSYIMPYKAIKDSLLILEPFLEFAKDGRIDGHDFINRYFRQEALGTYNNACNTAGIEFIGPYSRTKLDVPIDYKRIRAGETKYLVREVFKRLYKDYNMPAKIPMPRPTNEWMKNWSGPRRQEFWPHCTDNMSGDQKWLVYCLEWFLNLIEDEKI